MRTLKAAIPALTSACLFLAVAAIAQDTKDEPVDDRTFVKKAASGGLFEVQSSQIALQRGQADEVKTFANQMILDHTKANTELVQAASAAGIPVTKALLPHHQMMIDQLSQAQGQQFDPTYWQGQLKAHQESVKLFENATKSVQDAQLKAFATKNLPILRDHLKMVRQHSGQGDDTDPGKAGDQ